MKSLTDQKLDISSKLESSIYSKFKKSQAVL